MSDPELYEWYSAEEATPFFGSLDEAQNLCNGQWLVDHGRLSDDYRRSTEGIALRAWIEFLLGR